MPYIYISIFPTIDKKMFSHVSNLIDVFSNSRIDINKYTYVLYIDKTEDGFIKALFCGPIWIEVKSKSILMSLTYRGGVTYKTQYMEFVCYPF